MKKKREKLYTLEEVIDGFSDMYNENFYKLEKYPKFTIEEIKLIYDLVFLKKRDPIFLQILDYITDNHFLGMDINNTASLRRIEFFRNFLTNKGNATRAAIASGYSSKSAKQAGYRVLKWIQKQQNTSI